MKAGAKGLLLVFRGRFSYINDYMTVSCDFNNTQELNTHRPAETNLWQTRWTVIDGLFKQHIVAEIYKWIYCSVTIYYYKLVIKGLKESTGSCLIWVWINTMKSMLLSSFLKCSISFSKRWFSEQTFKIKHTVPFSLVNMHEFVRDTLEKKTNTCILYNKQEDWPVTLDKITVLHRYRGTEGRKQNVSAWKQRAV